ncbi:MAG: DUF488 domain-containing protein, partial [Thermoleophilaceae bacterium]|nr:DUF488 domain-containing protein [Thermoleophilaceae bacterium]
LHTREVGGSKPPAPIRLRPARASSGSLPLICKTVFTIGHSTHEPGTFAALLARHDVNVLVDVRRHPGSRRVPWTNPEQIERALPIAYVHVPELGGRRRPTPGSPTPSGRTKASARTPTIWRPRSSPPDSMRCSNSRAGAGRPSCARRRRGRVAIADLLPTHWSSAPGRYSTSMHAAWRMSTG